MTQHQRSASTIAIVQFLESRQLLAAPALDVTDQALIPVGDENTLYIPIRGTTTGNQRVRYSFTVTPPKPEAPKNPEFYEVGFRSGDSTWIRMSTEKGDMDLQLFDDLAPDTVRRMLGLIKSHFFDGLVFHRTIAGFVIQGGDPKGDGTGGPEFTFDDEFHKHGLFLNDGVLAMANSGKDTNGSQFFITALRQGFPPRGLDFNHTVWGQLVRGFDVRDAIINGADTDMDGLPDDPVVINSVRIIKNRTDAVLFVRASQRALGHSAILQVTGSNDDGSTTARVLLSGTNDVDPPSGLGGGSANNDPPILSPVGDVTMPRNGTLEFKLKSYDPEGSDVEYAAELIDLEQGTLTVNNSRVIYTPPTDFVGKVEVLLGVRAPGAVDRGSTQGQPFDTQLIQIAVGDKKATGAAATNLSAIAGAGSFSLNVATFTDSDSTGVAENWTASIDWGDGEVSDGLLVQNTDGTFSVLGDHEYPTVADDLPTTVTVQGDKGARLIMKGTVDTRDIATLTSKGTLIVNGSSGKDAIDIRVAGSRFEANVNGVIKRFGRSLVKRLQVNAFEGNDVITTSTRPAVIDAGAGKDRVTTGDGDDLILGGGGNDVLTGGAGADTLDGGNGTDTGDSDSLDTRISIEVLA